MDNGQSDGNGFTASTTLGYDILSTIIYPCSRVVGKASVAGSAPPPRTVLIGVRVVLLVQGIIFLASLADYCQVRTRSC